VTTLTQNTLNYNKQIKLSDDGGSLFSDSGQFVIREFDERSSASLLAANQALLVD